MKLLADIALAPGTWLRFMGSMMTIVLFTAFGDAGLVLLGLLLALTALPFLDGILSCRAGADERTAVAQTLAVSAMTVGFFVVFFVCDGERLAVDRAPASDPGRGSQLDLFAVLAIGLMIPTFWVLAFVSFHVGRWLRRRWLARSS